MTFDLFLSVCFQEILGSDETSHVLQNLDIDTEYDVTVTAIYPDESESEDLMGRERTRESSNATPPPPPPVAGPEQTAGAFQPH